MSKYLKGFEQNLICNNSHGSPFIWIDISGDKLIKQMECSEQEILECQRDISRGLANEVFKDWAEAGKL